MDDAPIATGWADVEQKLAALRAEHPERVVSTISEPRDRGYRAPTDAARRKIVLTLPVARGHAPLVLVALAMPLAAVGLYAYPPLLIALAVIAVRLVTAGMPTKDVPLVVEGDTVRVSRSFGREWRARVVDPGFLCKWSERTKMLVLSSTSSGAITLDLAADTTLGASASNLVEAIARALREGNQPPD